MTRYRALLPSIADLLGTHNLDPSVCFQLWRPALAAEIRPKLSSTGEVVAEAKEAKAEEAKPVKAEGEAKEDKMEVEEEGVVEEAIPEIDPEAPWPAALGDAVAALEQKLSADEVRIMTWVSLPFAEVND